MRVLLRITACIVIVSAGGCAGPDEARLDSGGTVALGPAGSGTPPRELALPEAGPDYAQAAAAALSTFIATEAGSFATAGGACLGYVSPAAGPPEAAAEWRSLFSFPQPLHDDLAEGRSGWRPIALCAGGPGLATVARDPAGGEVPLLYCQGIRKVQAGWRMYCGARGPGPLGRLPEYLVTSVADSGALPRMATADRTSSQLWRVVRTCPACALGS